MKTHTRAVPFEGPAGERIAIAPTLHWRRWVVGVIAVAVVLWALSILILNPNIRWNRVWEYLFSTTILEGVWVTIWVSLAATVLGLITGVLLAVMKISQNPVLRWIAEGYIWFFRGTPVLVQLIFWFNLAFLLPYITLKIPFTNIGMRWDTNVLISGSIAALLGLGLNLAAYFAETVRAGIQAVDQGQREAALAGGMTNAQTMRLIVLPQALRIIIPPTGNEFISMLKTTSLIVVVAGNDLMTNASRIYKQNNLIIELLIVASLWYMLMTAIATYLQSLLEKRFGQDRVRVIRGEGFAQKMIRVATESIKLPGADQKKGARR
ncbi:polar amino acid transport system permease protein [Leucobacter exalbidus]|uniref:Polar amino acid transport system permease protein n=1 Tax=Leucobacter exalbidus TaxID=662960 RepID=A0A940PSH0_9MICO|nr:amino acid ABC transporter permease [Leucobacter exalbidus]MBP1325947.1 polar amino acid transport system permease protein [Leucobacter exalbidus]